jgi:hypothetical protein
MGDSKRIKLDFSENISGYHSCHNGSHLKLEAKASLCSIAESLATEGKGITACDESAATIGRYIFSILNNLNNYIFNQKVKGLRRLEFKIQKRTGESIARCCSKLLKLRII